MPRSFLRPLLQLPSAIKNLNNRSDTWILMRSGLNPLEINQQKGKLIGKFSAASTAQNTKLVRKRVLNFAMKCLLYTIFISHKQIF